MADENKYRGVSSQRIVAEAIVNAKGARRGVPPINNIMQILPQPLLNEVTEEADAVIAALKAADRLIK